MKKTLFVIAIIFMALNCMGQRYYHYSSPRHYYSHYSSPRYYSTYHHSYNSYGSTYYVTSQTNKDNYDYDWKTYECVNPNEIDTVIMFDDEEYEMFVYPQGHSFDTKSYWNNEPLELPKWVKTMIYYDLCYGKKYTEFLISPQFNKYYGEGTNISLHCVYNYRVVFKSKTHEYEYEIFGKGGCPKRIQLGEYNLYFKLHIGTFYDLENNSNGIYELTDWGADKEDYDLIFNYLKENQERLGVNLVSNGGKYDGIKLTYWLDEVWSDQAKQLYSLYNKQKRNSLN